MAPLLYISAFLFTLVLACCAELINQHTSYAGTVQSLSGPLKREAPSHDPLADSELLDVVLVASVDGKLHALNRTTGRNLWSMPSFTSPTPSNIAPLVRTNHIDYDPDMTDDSVYQETYIIEPQSGDIYVMATPSSPLQRFPFSMSELVDMSPYHSFSADDHHRVFIGKKQTSLLVVELETGRIKATIDSESECPWDPFEDMHELDLDELDGTKPQMEKATDVFIGRTDYYITIHTRPSNKQKIPPQNLSFSAYGPNNQDIALQAAYKRTKDNMYIQSLSTGQILSFKAPESIQDSPSNPPVWGSEFNDPIVAIFDVLRSSTNTFVLLQPRPQLSAILHLHEMSSKQLPHLESAYVGLVKESGSLFAMSPDRFPLVAFADGARTNRDRARLIDGAPTEGEGELPATLNEITRMRKEREQQYADNERCFDPHTDRRCLVGIRPLDGGDGPEMRLKRLLDGVPGALPWDLTDNVQRGLEGTVKGVGNGSTNHTTLPDSATDVDKGSGMLPTDHTSNDVLIWRGAVFALVLGAVGLWFGMGKIRGRALRSRTRPLFLASSSETAVTFEEGESAPPTPMPRIVDTPTPPSPLVSKKLPPLPPPEVAEDGEESEREEEENGEPSAKPGQKTHRGRRANKKNKKNKKADAAGAADPVKPVVNGNSANLSEKEKENGVGQNGFPPNGIIQVGNLNPVSPSGLSFTSTTPLPSPAIEPSLVVSDTVLGYGSHGTVVYRGSLQGRSVAVKRLLQDFVTLAAREVSILQESDDHPNVIRYYYQEAHSNFLYIALELCPATLADLVETPDRDAWRDIAVAFEPKRALRQITSGLRHLHGLKLVHRDIKPQNILVSAGTARGGVKSYRMLISDFGLCKKLDVDQTSFLPTSHGTMAAGTVGWRAPEILRGDVRLEDGVMAVGDDASVSSQGTAGSGASSGTAGKPTRLTKSVDIFALGCLFFYTLTSGGHPFGDRFEREANIMKGAINLTGLERFGEEGEEAVHLISAMIHSEASERPDTTTILLHPFFWDAGRRLTFLQDASDRFEIMTRDPKDPYLLVLERGAFGIVGNDWQTRLDRLFLENLGKFRKYDGRSIQDLLRALRNKKHHYQDLPDNVKRHLGPMPEGFLTYFTRRFPRLFLHVHAVIEDTSLRSESMFRSYFELHDS